MADIEMIMINRHGAVAGAAKEHFLLEIEEYSISTQRRIQHDGGSLPQLENIYGGPTPRGVLSKRLQQELMEGVQQQEINTGRTVRTTGEYTIST